MVLVHVFVSISVAFGAGADHSKKCKRDILGLTVPRRLGPKQSSNIRKLYNLTMENDFRRFVVKHPLPENDVKKAESEALKIQLLIR